MTEVRHPALRETPSISARGSPFCLDNEAAYQRWRESKLAGYPLRVDELIVEVNDPRALTKAEHRAIKERCGRADMAIYATNACALDKDILRLLGKQLGLRHLEGNWLADEDGISQVTASAAGGRRNYIPYTNRSLNWHTDGYYNSPDRRIWAMLLHCVSQAPSGGENALLDHEIAYLLMRDEDPTLAGALMAPDAMTIPARTDEAGVARREEVGPVFHIDPVSGCLHMRYTARTRSILWRRDPLTEAAVGFLERLLAGDSPYVYRIRLAPGMGIVSNNVLHARSAFEDGPDRKRLLYRARYLDRIDGH